MEKSLRALFVYGILKRRYANAQRATVRGFRLVDMGSFPAAIPCQHGVIVGELIFVDDETVKEFDRIEGHPNFYIRTDVEVDVCDGNTVELVKAQMYVVTDTYHEYQSESTNSLTIKKADGLELYEYNC